MPRNPKKVAETRKTNIEDFRDVHEIDVEDVSSWDEAAAEEPERAERQKPPARRAQDLREDKAQQAPSSVVWKRRDAVFESASAAQENLLRALTSARQTLKYQQEQALAGVEKTCLESIAKLETTITKLRLEKRWLEEENLRAEDRRVTQVAATVTFSQGPRSAGVPLPASEIVVSEPHFTAPSMDIQSFTLGEEAAVPESAWLAQDTVPTRMRTSMVSGLGDPVKAWDSRNRSVFCAEAAGGMTQLSRAKAAEARAGRGKNVFVDASSMKERVKEAVMKPEYNVFDYYKVDGPWQQVARSNYFENTTLVIVFINAIWIWIDTDFNHSETLIRAHPVFILVENFFCTYFSCELFIRFMAFQKKRHCFQDAWFNFDTVLVLLMIIETWVLTFIIALLPDLQDMTSGSSAHQLVRLVRLMRLTRMARMVRLLRAIPELMVLFKSVIVAIRSVVFTLCLLVVFIYIFALIFVQLDQSSALGDAFQDNLKTVPDAMAFLLLRGILPDLADYVYNFGNATVLGSVIFLAFILVASLTIMNMLMGVLVQVIGAVSDVERERMTVQWVKVKLLEMMESTGIGRGVRGIDDDGNMQISKGEFQRLLLNPKAAKMVQEVGVDVVGLVDFADFIFENDKELTFAEFMDLVLQLRGTNIATVKDIVDLRKFFSIEIQTTVTKELERGCARILRDLRSDGHKAIISAKPFCPKIHDNSSTPADEEV